MKKTPFILGTVAAATAAAAGAAAFVADKTYRVTCLHTDKQKQHDSNPHIEFGGEQYKDINPKLHELISEEENTPFEEIEIKSSHDETLLYGRLFRFTDSPIINIFFHGYRGTAFRDGCGGFEMSRDMGINALLVDQRANGRSGGNTITFGILERYDCLDWANYISKRFPDSKIVLSGVSLGAATVLNASDLDLPENVKCIIADCGFTSPKEIICKVAKEQGYPIKICYPLLKLSCKLRAGFDLDESSALEAVSNTKIPILIIHGDDDRYVPVEMGERLYDACASKKQFLKVHGAPHAASYMIDKDAYTKTAGDFIFKYCRE